MPCTKGRSLMVRLKMRFYGVRKMLQMLTHAKYISHSGIVNEAFLQAMLG